MSFFGGTQNHSQIGLGKHEKVRQELFTIPKSKRRARLSIITCSATFKSVIVSNFESGGFDLLMVDPFGSQTLVDLKSRLSIDDETARSGVRHAQFSEHLLVTFETGNIAMFDKFGTAVRITSSLIFG